MQQQHQQLNMEQQNLIYQQQLLQGLSPQAVSQLQLHQQQQQIFPPQEFTLQQQQQNYLHQQVSSPSRSLFPTQLSINNNNISTSITTTTTTEDQVMEGTNSPPAEKSNLQVQESILPATATARPGQDSGFPSLVQQKMAMSSFSGQSIGDQLQNLPFSGSLPPSSFDGGAAVSILPLQQASQQPYASEPGMPCSSSNNNVDGVGTASETIGLHGKFGSGNDGSDFLNPQKHPHVQFGGGSMESNSWATSMFPLNSHHQQQQQLEQQQQFNQLQNYGNSNLYTNISKLPQAVSPTSMSSSSILPKDMMATWLLDQTQQQQQTISTPSLGSQLQQQLQLQHQAVTANFLQDSPTNSSPGSSTGLLPQQLDVHLHHHHHHHLYHYPQQQPSGGGAGTSGSSGGGGVTIININNESMAKANSNASTTTTTPCGSFPLPQATSSAPSTSTTSGDDPSSTHWVRRVGVFSAVHPFQDGSNSFPFLEQASTVPQKPTSSLPLSPSWASTGNTVPLLQTSPQQTDKNFLQQGLAPLNMPYQQPSVSSPVHSSSSTSVPYQFLPSSLSSSMSAGLPKVLEPPNAASFSYSTSCPQSPQHHPHLAATCSLAVQGTAQVTPGNGLLIGQSQGQGHGILEETMDLS